MPSPASPSYTESRPNAFSGAQRSFARRRTSAPPYGTLSIRAIRPGYTLAESLLGNFDRDSTAEASVQDFTYNAHAAFSNERNDFGWTEARAR